MNEIVEVQEPARREIAPATPSHLLQLAVEQGADIEKLERLMALQERWEAAQAKRAYDDAFAKFKGETIKILKGETVKDGPLKGRSYARLIDWVSAATPELSKHGLSSSWKITKDEKDWIEVTCFLRHRDGHSESVSMGGPPDTGGAKNAIQARASTISYLEKYTFKAITGLSEQDDDTDGNASNGVADAWITIINQCLTENALDDVAAGLGQEIEKESSPITKPIAAQIRRAWSERRKVLKAGVAQ